MISIQKCDDAYIVRHIGDLDLPNTISDIGDFKNTLNLLYSWKRKMQNLEKIIKSAVNRMKKEKVLGLSRKSLTRARSVGPDTLFTPTKDKKGKKTKRLQPIMLMMIFKFNKKNNFRDIDCPLHI
jgi:hypothetical protein